MHCPQMKTAKLEQMDIDGALVELDYVSQENKDIQKRRKFLFRMVLKNDIEYIMQAPNLNQRKTWLVHRVIELHMLSSQHHYVAI